MAGVSGGIGGVVRLFDYSGQWIGPSTGYPEGEVVLDVELRDGVHRAVAYLYTDNSSLPSTATEFAFPKTDEVEFGFRATIWPFDPKLGRILSEAELSNWSPPIEHSTKADFEFHRLVDHRLKVSWKTEIGTSGEGVLGRTVMKPTSQVKNVTDVTSWAQFRDQISELDFGDFVFRGQSVLYPLQTTFHRTKRKNLHLYLQDDIPKLHRSITGQTSHFFDLNDPSQNGAFLNLAQHHGFPTPLLDWTYSPFVAAWFAYHDAVASGDDKETDKNIRVFQLNKKRFSRVSQFQNLTFSPPHFSILEALAIDNNRAIPQQGLLTLTNVQDIEAYILKLEHQNDDEYLSAYDLPASEAKKALNDLAMMGITRSTLFPGIESTCADMKQRLFD